MADAAISSLPAAEEIFSNDLFVLEQNGEAKKLLGQLLTEFVDRNVVSVSVTSLAPNAQITSTYNAQTGALTIGIPRGCGIANVEKTSTSGLVDTYTITFEAPYGGTARPPITFAITNGRGITKIEKTSGTHAPGTLDTYTITYNNGTTSTFQVYNGQDGMGSPGSATPKMDGTATVGTANAYSREDHVHPSDTSRATVHDYTGTLSTTSWQAQGDAYRKTVSLTGILSSDVPIIDMVASGTLATDEERQAEWSKIFRVVCSSNQLTFYASSPTEVSIPFIVRCIR